MPQTPTARTLARLRETGHLAAVVERRLPRGSTTVDLFGCFDVVAVKASVCGVLGVQCTSASHAADRVRRLLARPELAVWLLAGNAAEVWGWARRGPRGGRKLWAAARVPLAVTPAGVCEVQERTRGDG